MSKQLTELFNLNEPDSIDEQMEITKSHIQKTQTLMSAADKINQALPVVKDLEASDAEVDAVATSAMQSYNDLMDLGMNVEPSQSAKIFEVASHMLKIALSAKSGKIDRKLKTVDLQIKNRRLDGTQQNSNESINSDGSDDTIAISRNELLQGFIKQAVKDRDDTDLK